MKNTNLLNCKAIPACPALSLFFFRVANNSKKSRREKSVSSVLNKWDVYASQGWTLMESMAASLLANKPKKILARWRRNKSICSYPAKR